MDENRDLVADAADTRLDARRLGVLFCCLWLSMIDGFNIQVIGFAAPAIVRAWHLAPSALGPIFGAGLFGSMVGAGLGILGDRLGLVRALILFTLMFVVGTAATAWASDPAQLMALRFLTGIGLGGTLPNLMALTASQAPARIRATLITIVITGAPLGAGLGGFASGALIATWGWQAVFAMGALVPLPGLLLLWMLRPRDAPPRTPLGAKGSFLAGFAILLSPRYRAGTLVLWVAVFFSVMLTYTLASWLPTLLTERGLGMRQAVLATVFLNLGVVVGGIGLGRLSDLWGPYKVLAAGYLLGAGPIALIGLATGEAAIFVAIFTAAVLALGGQTGIGMVSTLFYESSVRATGVGVAILFGRLGAVVGPVLVGGLLAAGAGIPMLFLVGGVMALLIAGLIGAMARVTLLR